MAPYWFLFAVVAWLTITRPGVTAGPARRWPGWWWAIFGLLVLMIGLRFEVGGDWGRYALRIDVIESGSSFNEWVTGDPAYALLNWLAAQSGVGVYFVNTVCAAIFSWGLIVFCRLQPRAWLAMVAAVPYLVIVVAMGYTRQSAAIGFGMLGLVSLSERRLMRFVIFVVIAATFHKSAVILMPLAMLMGTRRRLWNIMWVGTSTAAAYVLLLQDSVAMLNRNYMLAEYQSEGAGARVAMNAVPAVVFLLFRRRFVMSQEDRKFWTWMSLGALLFIGWLAVSPSSTAVDRVALYWIPLQLFVLARAPDAVGAPYTRIVTAAIMTYSAAVQFVWLNFAFNSIYWIPYKFYPWVVFWR